MSMMILIKIKNKNIVNKQYSSLFEIISPFFVFFFFPSKRKMSKKSWVSYKRKDRKTFIVDASIWARERENFWLTSNLTVNAFRLGNQYDEFWRNRMRLYIQAVYETIFDENPAPFVFTGKTCVEVGRQRAPPAGRGRGRGRNLEVNMPKRTFHMTIKLQGAGNYEYDIPFRPARNPDGSLVYVNNLNRDAPGREFADEPFHRFPEDPDSD